LLGIFGGACGHGYSSLESGILTNRFHALQLFNA